MARERGRRFGFGGSDDQGEATKTPPATTGDTTTMPDSYVQIDPEAEAYPILPSAGKYGPGLDFSCDVELTGFEFPADDKLPAYDRDNERGPYAYLGFRVKSEDLGLVFYDHWEPIGKKTGSKIKKYLVDLGVNLDDNGGFDPNSVAPRKVGGIEVRDPREDPNTGRKYNGRLVGIIGA